MNLIERDSFLATLRAQFKKVTNGEGHCLLVSGEAGIGKTALVKAFCTEQKDNCTIYQGACDALFTPRLLAPLYDIIGQVNGDLWPKGHSIEERSELFSGFFRELSNHKEKTLIVFEDVHWADEATLDFIKFFARRITRLPCLFILTYRDDEIHANYALRNVLGQLPPDSFTRIQLTALSREAVYKLAEEKGFDPVNVYNISGGNPFYVNEILASYSPGVPDNIKDSILAVYDRQDEGTKNAWRICSVIPEGLEISRFAKIKASWDEGMDHCFALKIIVIKNDKVIFKHELYRRTIEASLSPFKRIALNKKILELFLASFEEEGEIERIVHYAKNGNENEIVVRYAPIAARHAASIGSHVEAAKLFLTAIEYSGDNNKEHLVHLYEAYAYECYLTNQLKDAIIYQGKALKIWQEKNHIEHSGNCLRFLSRLWWLDGNREKGEKYGIQAMELLQSQAASKAKAMALSNMSQLKMLSEETVECVRWGNMAIEMAKEIKDDEILCHALNNVGSAQMRVQSTNEAGKKLLQESLAIALKNSFHEHVARTYSNMVNGYLAFNEYDPAKQYLKNGINYCEARNLDSSKNYQLSLHSKMLMETGNWKEAASIAEKLLANTNQLGTVKISALHVLTAMKIRMGDPDGLSLLMDAKMLAFKMKEHLRIMPLMNSFLVYEWLTGKKVISEDELKLCLDLAQRIDSILLNSEFDFWLRKARKQESGLMQLYEPYRLLKAGKIKVAVSFWEKTGCPYEKAFALFEGNEEDKKNAVLIFQRLGAVAVCDKIKLEMRAQGIKRIPRGLRESTRDNPAQLTNREMDVLQLLQKGIQSREVAGTLFISTKTVDHHISSILFKLDVKNRSRAVTEAVRLGILK